MAQIRYKGVPDRIGRLPKQVVQAHLIPHLSIAASGKYRRPILSPYQGHRRGELSVEPGLSVILASGIRHDQEVHRRLLNEERGVRRSGKGGASRSLPTTL
jgi:hypothetical protein